MTTTLQKLTADDVRYCANRDSNGGLLNQFNENLGDHQMTVLHDEGLYWHLRFKNPDNGFYWFDLITWPGNLTITGDMGTYTFARTEDMFTFFTGYINTDYWAEKLQHGSGGGRASVKNYSEDLFKKWLVQDFWESTRDASHETTTTWWQILKDDVLGEYAHEDCSTTETALSTIAAVDRTQCAPLNHYLDAWEAAEGWKQYTSHFEWCLAAIVTGIRTYKAHKTQKAAK